MKLPTISLLALLLAASCSTPVNWQELEDESDFSLVWSRFVQMASVNGFYPDPQKTDRPLRKYVSRWIENPAPFRRMSERMRLHGEFERIEEAPGWRIRFYVERQIVDDMKAGFEPEDGDWKGSGQDFEREQILYGQLRLALGQDLGVSPTFQRR